jgi:F0F1-type ATP synthase delta subunit
VAKNYDRALLPKIIMQLKKLERSKGGIHEVVLTSARPLEKAVVVEIKKKVGEGSHIKEVVDEEVLGGLKILINDEMVIDGTYKTRINRMVEAVIKAVE